MDSDEKYNIAFWEAFMQPWQVLLESSMVIQSSKVLFIILSVQLHLDGGDHVRSSEFNECEAFAKLLWV